MQTRKHNCSRNKTVQSVVSRVWRTWTTERSCALSKNLMAHLRMQDLNGRGFGGAVLLMVVQLELMGRERHNGWMHTKAVMFAGCGRHLAEPHRHAAREDSGSHVHTQPVHPAKIILPRSWFRKSSHDATRGEAGDEGGVHAYSFSYMKQVPL
jgi:hypothetical protein